MTPRIGAGAASSGARWVGWAKLATMTAGQGPSDVDAHHAPDVHGADTQSELDAHGDDAVGHDLHGHEAPDHDAHRGGDDSWVIPPLVVGLVLGIIVVIVVGLGGGASPIG